MCGSALLVAMTPWDDAAARHLAEVVEALNNLGLIDLLHGQVADTWRTNMERYEQSRLGDTPRAFGFLSAENIQQRLVRLCSGPASTWYELGVRVATPDNSLLIRACGVDIHVMKAPSSQPRTPDWDTAFTWSGESATRQRCARRNSEQYLSSAGAAPDGSLFALPEASPAKSDATRCRDAFLVWSGEVSTGLTAGWLGLPCDGERPWLAVQRLWWDEAGGPNSLAEVQPAGPQPTDGFEAQPLPSAPVRLKPRRAQEGSS